MVEGSFWKGTVRFILQQKKGQLEIGGIRQNKKKYRAIVYRVIHTQTGGRRNFTLRYSHSCKTQTK